MWFFEHLTPKSWVIICWCNSFLSAGFRLSTRCWNHQAAEILLPSSHMCISEVQYWCCWAIRSGLTSVFQFISRVLDGVEVGIQVLPNQTEKTISSRGWLCVLSLKQEGTKRKLLPQSWKFTIVSNILVCWFIWFGTKRASETMRNGPGPKGIFDYSENKPLWPVQLKITHDAE